MNVPQRRPLNLTLEDLETDEVEDENWEAGLSTGNGSGRSAKKTRVMPRRKAVADKKAAFSDESD